MENNYEFWNKYLKKIKNKILEICDSKKYIYIDFHIHSNYSSDGKQSINDILKSTREKGFDFIAITDHDILNAYDEIYELVKKDLTIPIIIPGIEFTVDNREYGNQCHILQLFINPKDDNLMNNVKVNFDASFNRSKIQFKRLKENKAFAKLIKKKNIKLSYLEYVDYLEKNNLLPEYDTLCNYLSEKFEIAQLTNFDILSLLEKYNDFDCYEDRKNFKKTRFNKLRKKYNFEEKNYFDSHFLLSMLAVREVDDDWWPSPSSGSLSVNSYGQLKLNELNKEFMTFWAHPTESKLSVVNDNMKQNKSIIGLEKNIRNEYKNLMNFDSIILNNNLYEIIGSDSHDNTNIYYEDMTFYKMDSQELKRIIIGDKDGKN